MNAHALAAVHTRQPAEETREAWIVHCTAICCAWGAFDAAVRRELEVGFENH